MIYQKQKYRHAPEKGEYGDCHRTALACVLDLPRDSVPNFGEHYGDRDKFFQAEKKFLVSQGLTKAEVGFSGELEAVLATMGGLNPTTIYLLAGRSKSGFNHSVVCCGGGIIWDPHPDDVGIVGPTDNGFYWVTFLVPLTFKLENDNGNSDQ